VVRGTDIEFGAFQPIGLAFLLNDFCNVRETLVTAIAANKIGEEIFELSIAL